MPELTQSATLRTLPAPAAVARLLRGQGMHVDVLESALDEEGLGRRSYVMAEPLAVASAEAGQDLRLLSGPDGLPSTWAGDPLVAAGELLERTRPAGWRPDPGAPFSGGAVLSLGFDLGRRYERLPSGASADVSAPDLHVAIYGQALELDHLSGALRVVGQGAAGAAERLLTAAQAAASEPSARARAPSPAEGAGVPVPACTFDAAGYRAAVLRAMELIRRGDLFEVNLSRRYTLEGVDPELLYARMRELAPAPFMADLDLGAGRRLLSASPERFLRLDAEGLAESWPIKGTRPRGATPAEDARLVDELLACEKEAAELAMIVDLVRNDLGRVAEPGSVRVRDPRRVQSWPTVHHTVGVIEARLAASHTWVDLVRAAFPPGSVTGAPKIRALEVIDALEPVRRGLYCGAFGYVGWDARLDLAVAIRIAACDGRRAYVHAGGAVLLDSDPAAEERETLAKADALLKAAARAGARG